jgi:hypothetical protein
MRRGIQWRAHKRRSWRKGSSWSESQRKRCGTSKSLGNHLASVFERSCVLTQRSLWWLIEWFCCWRTTDTQRLERPDHALHVTPSDLLCTKTVLTSWACENTAWEWLTSSAFHLFTPHTRVQATQKARPRPRHRQSVIESRHVDRLVVL